MNYWKEKILKVNLPVLLAIVGLIGFTSCDNDDEDDIEPVSIAYVSLYNASPDSPGLDISVDNRQINAYPFDYADNTGYLRFYTGERNLRFSPFDASNVTLDTLTTFEQGKAYSVFLAGEFPDMEALILNDNAPEPADGHANIRIVHLSPDAGNVDLETAGMETPVFEDQAYKDYTSFSEIDAGSHNFEVRAADGSEAVLEIPDVYLSEGLYYTILVRGYSNPPGGNENFLSAQVLVN